MPSPQRTDPDGARTPSHCERAADAVRRRRLELGWTQEQLAERSGVSAATVRKLEAGSQAHYRDLTCTRLCAALGWGPDALDGLRTPTRHRSDTPTPTLNLTTRHPTASGDAAHDTATPPPSAQGVATVGDTRTPSEAELAALNGRLAQLDERRWERLVAFVDGLTATDH